MSTLFFFVMILLPHGSTRTYTHFTYTTLFRSAPLRKHGQRYEHLAEWLQVVKMLLQSPDEFDHHGEFFDIISGISLPKPLQEGGPPIMNAGTRSEERRVGKECVSTCSSRWSPYH